MLSSLKRVWPIVILVLAGCQSVAPRHATYAVGARYPVMGAGGWDLLAVDSQREHLFLSRSDRVQVLQTGDGTLAGTIQGTDHVHGIAIAEALSRGFTTNGASNSVT